MGTRSHDPAEYQANQRYRRLTVYMTEADYREINRIAFSHQTNASNYVNDLLKKHNDDHRQSPAVQSD